MKQLFFKSNLLHIRTNEGEFEVINPEVVHTSPLVQFHRKWNEGDEVEWPHGVEFIDMCGVSDNKYNADGCSACHGLCPEVNKLARLLPKEEFKPAQPTPNFQKGGTTFTESAYKEFEEAAIKQGHVIESPEPQEKMSYWQYQQFTRAAITKLKEELVTTEKALRDQLEACEQHNKILCEQKVESLKEIERLKAEALKEKFPEN